MYSLYYVYCVFSILYIYIYIFYISYLLYILYLSNDFDRNEHYEDSKNINFCEMTAVVMGMIT